MLFFIKYVIYFIKIFIILQKKENLILNLTLKEMCVKFNFRLILN